MNRSIRVVVVACLLAVFFFLALAFSPIFAHVFHFQRENNSGDDVRSVYVWLCFGLFFLYYFRGKHFGVYG